MNFSTFFIKRPAFTIVMTLIMIIVGLIGFLDLPIRWVPNITPPQITISTEYPGASAQLVERDVTKIIEAKLSGLNGVESLSSTSRRDSSDIYITFKLGQNMDAAVEDVRSVIERARGELPRDVRNPVVMKGNPGEQAIMYLSFYDDRKSARDLSDYLDKYITPQFETIDGVASVQMFGKRVSAVKVLLDPAKMAGAKVTVDEVAQLLQNQNASTPSGQIKGKDRFYSIVTDTALKNPQQFNDLIIRDDSNQVVRLKDIGEAKIEAEDTDSVFRINGKSGIALGIVTQSSANPLDVEKSVKKVFKTMQRTLPQGMSASVIYNQADYIRASIKSVYESFFEAIFCVWLIILAFLCSFRATLIPIITIPVCILSSFTILYLLGFSINTITLMAFVLAIGLVVDDAIVMLENINRYIESGLTPLESAIKGSKEIVVPIIAMTITLAAVYAPIAFTPGLLGILFREFTFTLAGAVLISGLVALTLSPMMCARILKTQHKQNAYEIWFAKKMARMQSAYERILNTVLNKRHWVLGFLLIVTLTGGALYYVLPSELAPAEDMGEVYVMIAAPRGASVAYTDGYTKKVENILSQNKNISSYLTMINRPYHAFQLLILKPKDQRTQSVPDIIGELTAQVSELPGVRVNIVSPPPPLVEFVNSDLGDNIGLVITTTKSYDELQKTTQQLIDILRKDPRLINVYQSLKWNTEQFQVNIDRSRAADLHVPINEITDTISNLIAGRQIGKTDEMNVNMQLNPQALSNPNILNQLYVRNLNDQMISLNGLVKITESTVADVFDHYERLRASTIYLTLSPDVKVSEAISLLEQTAKNNLPDDMRYTFTGEAKSFLDASGKTLFTFALALVFIYLVLVAQFESFIDPLVIICTVPFAIVGALVTLKIFGGSLNIYSNIGLITLIGLIAKHGILITDFANRARSEGKSIHDAVKYAALLRLRPILMTTSAMILGALPLAFAFGPGAESRQQVGLVITGGMFFGTFFSLIVVPIAYTYLAQWRKINLIDFEQEENHAVSL